MSAPLPPTQTPPLATEPPVADETILLTAGGWLDQDRSLALAVVIRTWGSSPRRNGAMMLVRDDGFIAGSVSGGCVEADVVNAAQQTLTQKKPIALDYGVADETAWQVGLSCGGNITVWVFPLDDRAWLKRIGQRLRDRQSVHLTLDMDSGRMTDGGDASSRPNRLDRHGRFQLVILPSPTLLIIGAVHIAQHLAPMARISGFEVKIIDPRARFANAERFPDMPLDARWPQQALAEQAPDAATAIVTLTHDPKIDDAALAIALKSPAFAIAALGSSKTHANRLERLREAGFSNEALQRIHAPAGCDIGAETPSEIAVSILAQLIALRRQVQNHHSGS